MANIDPDHFSIEYSSRYSTVADPTLYSSGVLYYGCGVYTLRYDHGLCEDASTKLFCYQCTHVIAAVTIKWSVLPGKPFYYVISLLRWNIMVTCVTLQGCSCGICVNKNVSTQKLTGLIHKRGKCWKLALQVE